MSSESRARRVQHGVRNKNSSFLYSPARTTYEREGFTYDRSKGRGNCVMVREVPPSRRA